MARAHRLREIEQERGESLDTLIPRLLNELGTMDAVARELGTTYVTIFYWCQRNGVQKRVTWFKTEPEPASA